jgi:hypothetical protein
MQAVSIALAFQLVSMPMGTAGRERNRKRRSKENAETQRISSERRRTSCALYIYMWSREHA